MCSTGRPKAEKSSRSPRSSSQGRRRHSPRRQTGDVPQWVQKVLWTIRTTATLNDETWQRFTIKAREAGTTPARVLEAFITRYAAGLPSHDTTPKIEHARRAVAYVRVSSQQQADSGLSLEHQDAKVSVIFAGWGLLTPPNRRHIP